MEQTVRAGETLFSSKHIHLDKRVSIKQILISSILALCGGGGILFSMNDSNSDSSLSMALLSVGVILVIVAFYRFFTKNYEVVYKPTGSEVRSGSLYMDTVELQTLQQMMKKNDFSASSKLVFKEGGNGRLDYLVSKDKKFVATQLLQFVPYSYEAVSDVNYYTDDDAVAVAHCLGI